MKMHTSRGVGGNAAGVGGNESSSRGNTAGTEGNVSISRGREGAGRMHLEKENVMVRNSPH